MAWRSSETRDPTCISCTVKQILYHWAPRKTSEISLFLIFIYLSVLALCCSTWTRSCEIWDLVPLSRDQTRAPFIGSTESQPLDHQGSSWWKFHCRSWSIFLVLFCLFQQEWGVSGEGWVNMLGLMLTVTSCLYGKANFTMKFWFSRRGFYFGKFLLSFSIIFFFGIFLNEEIRQANNGNDGHLKHHIWNKLQIFNQYRNIGIHWLS